MKIVKFEDGTYGVRKGCWLFGYSFASSTSTFWYSNPDAIYLFCRFRTLDDAWKARARLRLMGEVVK